MSTPPLDDMAWRQETARALTPARKAALAVMARHQVDVRCGTRTSVEEASVAHRTAEWLRDRGLVAAYTLQLMAPATPYRQLASFAVTGCRLELTARGLDIVRSLGLDAR